SREGSLFWPGRLRPGRLEADNCSRRRAPAPETEAAARMAASSLPYLEAAASDVNGGRGAGTLAVGLRGLWADGAHATRHVLARPLRHQDAADDRGFAHAGKPLRTDFLLCAHPMQAFVDA